MLPSGRLYVTPSSVMCGVEGCVIRHSNRCQELPVERGAVETGRQEDGGINGASDEYLGDWEERSL